MVVGLGSPLARARWVLRAPVVEPVHVLEGGASGSVRGRAILRIFSGSSQVIHRSGVHIDPDGCDRKDPGCD